VILRILAQESHDSELRLERYERKKFGEQNWNFGSLQGYIGEYRMCGELLCKKDRGKIEFG
jgi:hypothetical protein